MSLHKFLTEVLPHQTTVLVSPTGHLLAAEISQQLLSYPKIQLLQSKSLEDLPEDEVNIVLHLAGFDPPSLAETLSLTTDLYRLLKFSISKSAKFILVLPSSTSHLSHAAITLVTQFAKNFPLDYIVIEIDRNSPFPESASAIIGKFIYGHKTITSIQDLPPKPSTRLLPPESPGPSHAVSSFLAQNLFSPPSKSRRHPLVWLFGLLILLPWSIYLVQFLFLGTSAACSYHFLKSGHMPAASRCAKVARFFTQTLALQTPFTLGSRQLANSLNFPLNSLFEATSGFSDSTISLSNASSTLSGISLSFFSGSVTSSQIAALNSQVSQAGESLGFLQTDLRNLFISTPNPPGFITSWAGVSAQSSTLISKAQLASSDLERLLSLSAQTTYLVLIQDNTELRPTGGYIDSFLIVQANDGKITDIQVYDSISADSQLRGQVDPPADLKAALNESQWYLRDSNWDPDFPSSAQKAAWFISKELSITPDVVVALNLSSFKDFLKVTGPVQLSDPEVTVNSKNLYDVYLSHAKEPSSPNSFIYNLTQAMLAEASSLNADDYNRLNLIFLKHLESRQVFIYPLTFKTPGLDSTGWSGGVGLPGCRSSLNCLTDYAYFVESNVGINKTNHHLIRQLSLRTELDSSGLNSQYTLSYQNNSLSQTWPEGTHKTYLRLFLPPQVTFSEVKINDKVLSGADYQVSSQHGLTVIGFTVETPPSSSTQAIISFRQPASFKDKFHYQFDLPIQPGAPDSPLEFTFVYPPNWEVTAYSSPKLPAPSVASPGLLQYNTSTYKAEIIDLDISPQP